MLDLEVVPERSLGCDNWEFILGNYRLSFVLGDSENFDWHRVQSLATKSFFLGNGR